MKKKSACGIYKITNQVNQKVYIGQSIKIEERWKDHKRESFKEDSEKYNYPLYQAMRKHGLENFKFEIIEECAPELLGEREKYYIALYGSYPVSDGKGYNQNPGGNGGISYKNKKFKDRDTLNLIRDYLINSNLKQKEIAKELNVCESTVSYVNKGKLAFDNNLNYPLRYNNNASDLNYSKIEASYNKLKEKNCPFCGGKMARKSKCCIKCVNYIYTISLSDNKPKQRQGIKVQVPIREDILKSFYELKNCQKVADKYGVSTVLLKRWRKELNLPEKVKDTIELYEKEYLGVVREERQKREIKKIAQISLNSDEILNTFDNAAEAGRYLNQYVFNQIGDLNTPRRSDSILNCCKGEIKSSYGFKWAFIK